MDTPPQPEPTEPAAPTEPATPFTWVIVAGVTVWLLGALAIILSRL